MIYEKSCGAVVYKIENNHLFFLIEHMKKGHYSIPKGHVEDGETEIETALREIKEETNLDVIIDDSFREVVSYSPYDGCIKDVVFFTALSSSSITKNQIEEVSDIKWLLLNDALNILTYDTDKDILFKAHNHIINNLKDQFVIINKGSKVLFQGDSVTDCYRDKSDYYSLGKSHAKIISDYLEKYDVSVFNRGVNGNKVNNLLDRFNSDFLDINPDVLFILIGVNDTWHDFPNCKSTAVFKKEYEELILLIKEQIDCEIILLEPFILGFDKSYTCMISDLESKISVIKELSDKYSLKYISFKNDFENVINEDNVYSYTVEGIHLLEKGYEILSNKILSYIIINE